MFMRKIAITPSWLSKRTARQQSVVVKLSLFIHITEFRLRVLVIQTTGKFQVCSWVWGRASQ